MISRQLKPSCTTDWGHICWVYPYAPASVSLASQQIRRSRVGLPGFSGRPRTMAPVSWFGDWKICIWGVQCSCVAVNIMNCYWSFWRLILNITGSMVFHVPVNVWQINCFCSLLNLIHGKWEKSPLASKNCSFKTISILADTSVISEKMRWSSLDPSKSFGYSLSLVLHTWRDSYIQWCCFSSPSFSVAASRSVKWITALSYNMMGQNCHRNPRFWSSPSVAHPFYWYFEFDQNPHERNASSRGHRCLKSDPGTQSSNPTLFRAQPQWNLSGLLDLRNSWCSDQTIIYKDTTGYDANMYRLYLYVSYKILYLDTKKI